MVYDFLAHSGRRSLRALMAVVAVAIVGVWATPGHPSKVPSSLELAGRPPGPVAERTLESAEEISLGALGLPSQPVSGPLGTVAVLVPAPLGPLSPSGSFAQLFFMHSPNLAAPASTVTIAVNGVPVATLPLDNLNADGGTFDAAVPAFLLRPGAPNLLEARFALQPATGIDASTAYARLDPQTLLHYQLFGPPGSRAQVELGSYPFPLLGRGGQGAQALLGVILPRQADAGELGSAFRLVADLGRHAYLQELVPQVVTSDPTEWVQSASTPAVLVGKLDRLPLAEDLLRAAGFSPGSAWSGPAGERIGTSDGLVIPVLSPWDGRTPLLLVSGGTDEALARAVQALTSPGRPPPSGRYLIVPSGAPQPPAVGPAPFGQVILGQPDIALQALGAGSHNIDLPLLLPPFGAGPGPLLELGLSHAPLDTAGASWLSVRLNGALAAQVPLDRSNEHDGIVRARVAGTLVHPGLNSLSLEFRLAGDGSGSPPLRDRLWARVAAGARLVLPAPPSRPGGLETAPGSMFEEPAGVLVAVDDGDERWLSAASRALAALGSRANAIPPIQAVGPGDLRPSSLHGRDLIAIGSGAATALGRFGGGPPVAERTADSGVVYERPLPMLSSREVLGVDTHNPDVVAAAARALYRHTLRGAAVGLNLEGRSWSLHADSRGAGVVEAAPAPLRALIAAAMAAMLLALGCQVLRPGELPR
jgi:Bacterial cellulose synthase subunit